MPLRVHQLPLSPDEPEATLLDRLAERLGRSPLEIARWSILKKSLDARRRDEPKFVYSVAVELGDPEAERGLATLPGIQEFEPSRFEWPDPGVEPLEQPPLVIGSGPAGLFAAYFLAQSGYRPLVIERGRAVKERVEDVRRFDRDGALDPESNYLFGEGGAGTFSDGKLTSRSSGPDVRRVLEVIVDCRGKPSILYEHRPHLGSNRLPLIVRMLRKRIEELGGRFQFNCRAEDFEIEDGRLLAVHTTSGRVPTQAAILAIGHSARDTYEMLRARGVPLLFKPFQFGVRIEQPQDQVNRARHGPYAGHVALGAADYELTTRAGDRDLFTFCMCAGGYVMASVSEPEHLCTNGMSESRHDSPFANSGLVVTIQAADLPTADPLAGVAFQRTFERLAYRVSSGGYEPPIQRAADYLAGRASRGSIPSSCARPPVPTDLTSLLPALLNEALHGGLPKLDRAFRRLFLKEATLTGPEARGSSPVRIPRDSVSRECPDVPGLYPCGEGAGYAGGIISAAVDGLRTARAIVARFAPPR